MSSPRILFEDGGKLVNVDLEGNPVGGWDKPLLDGALAQAVVYLNFSGKDYLMARTTTGKVHFYDRRGQDRVTSMQLDTTQTQVFFEKGKSLSACRFVGYDTSGHLLSQNVGGKVTKENILPIGSQVGVLHTGIDEYDVVTVSSDHLIILDREHQVSLDYLLPEAVSGEIALLDKEKKWIGLQAAENDHYYLLDLEGHMLDKMPVIGSGNALVLDLNGNGNKELIVSDGKRELRAYGLAD